MILKNIAALDEGESQCPKYEACRTGRDLPPEFCARYRCNTYYNINTIAICNRIYDYLAKRSSNDNENSCMPEMNRHRIEADIAKIVQEAVQEDLRKISVK